MDYAHQNYEQFVNSLTIEDIRLKEKLDDLNHTIELSFFVGNSPAVICKNPVMRELYNSVAFKKEYENAVFRWNIDGSIENRAVFRTDKAFIDEYAPLVLKYMSDKLKAEIERFKAYENDINVFMAVDTRPRLEYTDAIQSFSMKPPYDVRKVDDYRHGLYYVNWFYLDAIDFAFKELTRQKDADKTDVEIDR